MQDILNIIAQAASHREHGGIRYPQRRPGLKFGLRQRRQPLSYRNRLAPKVEGKPFALNQARRARDVVGRNRVMKCLQFQTVGLVPLAGPDVESFHMRLLR